MTEAPTAPNSANPDSGKSEVKPRPPLPATEMVHVSEEIKGAYSEDPDFLRIFEARKAQAKAVMEGWMKGEITLEQASEVVASQEAELEMALETDPLMDIPNRVALERMVMEQIALARRTGKPISVAFIDLDRFGDINKRYEEDAGDATLEAVGTFLKSELERPTDKVMRRSGEELIVLLPDTGEEGALHVLEGMRVRMPETVAQIVKDIAGYEFDRPITMSAGIVTETIAKLDPREDLDIKSSMMNTADSRMRMAKENGRDRVVDSIKAQQLQAGEGNNV